MTTNAAGAARTKLPARTRKAVLVVHVASAGAWIGIDVVMGVFVFTAIFSDEPRTRALCYQAIEVFAVGPLLTVGLLCLASGVVLGLGTKYGLVRYWWVAVKLVLNLVLVALVLVLLRPGVAELGETGRRLAEDSALPAPVGDMVFPPIVSTSALLVAVVLSVFKPWGRIRRQPESPVRRGSAQASSPTRQESRR